MRPGPGAPDACWAVGSGHRGPAAFLRDDTATWLSQAGPGEAHRGPLGHDMAFTRHTCPRTLTGPTRAPAGLEWGVGAPGEEVLGS